MENKNEPTYPKGTNKAQWDRYEQDLIEWENLYNSIRPKSENFYSYESWNIEITKWFMDKHMSMPNLPKGNQAQWDRYCEDLKRHEEFIRNYKFFLDRICNHMESRGKNLTWTSDYLRKTIASEIEMAESVDAPNPPGYTRANND